jgi:predicted protein tyrosine phosphatase
VAKRIYLFVCSANKLRSPTCEHVARSLGLIANSVAAVPFYSVQPTRTLSRAAIDEATDIICMEQRHAAAVLALAPDRVADVATWDIPDDYDYCEPALVRIVTDRLKVREFLYAQAVRPRQAT